jgi:2-polyprenyl-3-methyl-5-hydroxy-6-metoxy-1,4-benzoquinol methylase
MGETEEMNGLVNRPGCELCGSSNGERLISMEYSDPRVADFLEDYYEGRVDQSLLQDAPYEVMKCTDCGFIWQAYVLNESGMKLLYETWISPEESLRKKVQAELSLYVEYADQVKTAIELVDRRPGDIDILDFGMGWGHWCLMAKAFGCNAHGFEISRQRIDFARERGIRVFSNFPELREQRFDFINAEQVFEHVIQPRELLADLVTHLRAGGLIYLSVPNGGHVKRTVKRPEWLATKDAIQPLEHINCFVHETLVQLGQAAGLDLVDVAPPTCTAETQNKVDRIGGLLRRMRGRRKRKGLRTTNLYFRRR